MHVKQIQILMNYQKANAAANIKEIAQPKNFLQVPTLLVQHLIR